jgi:hypothetical protein
MFVGRAGPGITELSPADPGAILGMEGALRAPLPGSAGALADVPAAIQDDLRTILDAPQQQLATGTPDDALPVGPPLYARWHQRRHVVPATAPHWMRELNLDPRYRSAAGLGAQVIREFQEEFMNLAWQQVGDVLAANRLLAWAVLAQEIGRRLHDRHFVPLDVEALLKISAPMHARILLGPKTVMSGVHASRVLDQLVDAGFRRLTTAQNPRMKRLARLDSLATDPAGGLTSTMVSKVNTGRFDIEPTNVAADGITDIAQLSLLGSPQAGRVDISVWGGIGDIPAELVTTAQTQIAIGAGEPPVIAVRPDIRSSGVITNEHFEAITAGALGVGALAADQLAPLIDAASTTTSNQGFLIAPLPGAGAPTIEPLVVDGSGNVSIHRPGTLPNIAVGTLPGAMTRRTTRAGRLAPSRGVNRLRPPVSGVGALPEIVTNVPGVAADVPTVVLDDGTTETAAGIVVGDLIRQPEFIDTLVGAVADNVAVFDPGVNVVFEPPPLDLGDVKATVLTTIDPRRVVPLRIKSLIRFGDRALTDVTAFGGLRLAEDLGPVMAAPSIVQPMYERLLEYDRNAFLPGVDLIPPDTITLLETNPRFIESHMIGLNVEFARELLWREYPTDRRGTYFRQFWDRLDGELDIAQIHEFDGRFGLGRNLLGGGEDHVVLLVRGQLLRRYPGTAVYAVPSTADRRIDPTGAITEPMLWGRIDPDITFFGFPFDVETAVAGNGVFFVLQEPPTEPRFGFDVPSPDTAGAPTKWAEADWSDVGVEAGGHLTIAGNPMTNRSFGGVRFVTNSAHLAALSLQQPVRVAMHATEALRDLHA